MTAGNPFRRVQIGLAALALVVVAGTVGYAALGFGVLEALYQTVVTVSTVGYGFPHPIGDGVKVFTIVLILVGVGTALYTFTVTLELLIDGHMRDLIRRRRMERQIAEYGRTTSSSAGGAGSGGRWPGTWPTPASRSSWWTATPIGSPLSTIRRSSGDVTDDDTLLQAGDRAGRDAHRRPRHRCRQRVRDRRRAAPSTRGST